MLEAGLLGACCDPNKEEMYFYPENVFNYWNFRVLPLLRCECFVEVIFGVPRRASRAQKNGAGACKRLGRCAMTHRVSKEDSFMDALTEAEQLIRRPGFFAGFCFA